MVLIGFKSDVDTFTGLKEGKGMSAHKSEGMQEVISHLDNPDRAIFISRSDTPTKTVCKFNTGSMDSTMGKRMKTGTSGCSSSNRWAYS